MHENVKYFNRDNFVTWVTDGDIFTSINGFDNKTIEQQVLNFLE